MIMNSEAILELIKQNGPSLPVEISNKFGLNSYVANAYLNEMVTKGVLKKSGERVGSNFLFYVEGQDKAMQDKLEKLKQGVVKTAKMYSSDQGEVNRGKPEFGLIRNLSLFHIVNDPSLSFRHCKGNPHLLRWFIVIVHV